jgi:GH18 family chitinase
MQERSCSPFGLFRRIIAAVILACVAALPAQAKTPGPPVVIGYIAVFKGMEKAMRRADLSQYTHLNLAFVNPSPAGAVVRGRSMACMPDASRRMVTTAALRRAVRAAHRAGTKIMISLGGGVIPPCSGDWSELLLPGARNAVVRELIAFVDAYDLDGIDVDIEGTVLTKIDKAGNYTPFVAALSRALKARGKLLTCATGSYEGGMVPQSSIPYFDYIGPTWGPAGSEHSPIDQAQRDLQLWLKRGASRNRIVLGVPFYGYGFGTYKQNYAFRDIRAEFGAAAAEGDVLGTRCAGCSYLTYNGLATLRGKARLAREQVGGLMVWEIGQDTDDHLLVRTLRDAWAR